MKRANIFIELLFIIIWLSFAASIFVMAIIFHQGVFIYTSAVFVFIGFFILFTIIKNNKRIAANEKEKQENKTMEELYGHSADDFFIKYCVNCGSELKKTDTYCPSCGAKVEK